MPAVFEVAESALAGALDTLCTDATGGGLPGASAPAPGEVVITVRLGGPPLVQTSPPEAPSSAPETTDEDIPTVSGEIVDVPSETDLVPVRRQGFWSRLIGWLTGSRSS